ncbi:DUF2971 domain-containing protein [Shouchella hunanensis]|uniref:DUF2971 domain-containing protein n=1 Tax=Shouchella hunanensis TaxID=766894 RepID=A0ABY7W260_9BACI|nr:DUF2971 domain-containing protein [Shouchella hunanensis]WDF02944.1 DUF2971 domain-containing protein [Shouchella hunanensis]
MTTEEQFDLTQFQKSNEMDYILAAKILNSASNLTEMSNLLYSITRLHVPEKIYKYISLNSDDNLNQLKFNTLQDNKVFLSCASQLNDPFDSRGYFYKKQEMAKHPELKRFNGSIIDDFAKYALVCSFSKVGVNNMPMWAHYSNNHSGFCVEYEPKKNDDLFRGCLFTIQYTDDRIDITQAMDKAITNLLNHKKKSIDDYFKNVQIELMPIAWITQFLNCVKHSSWSYEKEVRLINSAVSTEVSVSRRAIPSAIYCGYNCSDEHIKELIQIAFTNNIPIYKMIFDEQNPSYELISYSLD